MRYAIFTDIHANLEALEAVLAKIDKIAQEQPIDQIWFLGDLVGYGPNPNECIVALRARTDVIITGNHDWAAVGKIDLEDFSAAARISAEWTAKQLTQEHRAFLSDLPDRLEIGDCTLVHGSPYGPLWEYLTSEMLAERSFRYFGSRYCFVGHTHVPVIFQQPMPVEYDEALANVPTLPLESIEQNLSNKVEQNFSNGSENGHEDHNGEDETETAEVMAAHHIKSAESAYAKPKTDQHATETVEPASDQPLPTAENIDGAEDTAVGDEESVTAENVAMLEEDNDATEEEEGPHDAEPLGAPKAEVEDAEITDAAVASSAGVTPIAEQPAHSEIEELLTLLGLSQSMIQVTNEMFAPPEGHWQAPEGYRFIINPGGVGQPRDGDPRAAFMIYDTERGFEFYRVPYAFEKTQEKIIAAGLPQYLAMRLAYGR